MILLAHVDMLARLYSQQIRRPSAAPGGGSMTQPSPHPGVSVQRMQSALAIVGSGTVMQSPPDPGATSLTSCGFVGKTPTPVATCVLVQLHVAIPGRQLTLCHKASQSSRHTEVGRNLYSKGFERGDAACGEHVEPPLARRSLCGCS